MQHAKLSHIMQQSYCKTLTKTLSNVDRFSKNFHNYKEHI